MDERAAVVVSRVETGTSGHFNFFGMDLGLLVVCALLVGMGTMIVYSALFATPRFDELWVKHLAALILGVLCCGLLTLLPYAFLAEISNILYILAIGSLVLVLAAGRAVHGSKSWFILGPIQFQPSEFAELATILFMAQLTAFYWNRFGGFLTGREKLKLISILVLPMLLVLMQNDLSSALSFVFVALVYIWAANLVGVFAYLALLMYGVLIFVFLLGHIAGGLTTVQAGFVAGVTRALGFGPGLSLFKATAWFVMLALFSTLVYQTLKGILILPKKTSWRWAFVLNAILFSSYMVSWTAYRNLKTYQKNRLISFIYPKADPLGSGYNIAQSKIAIGSGGILGRGFLQGSQATLGFLPERHTDFAFSTLGEQMGFLGTSSALFLFGILFWRLTLFARAARDEFGRLIALGLLGLWGGEICINIACALGLFPVLGIGLPFLSYGGSRLVLTLMETGILLSISRGFYVYR